MRAAAREDDHYVRAALLRLVLSLPADAGEEQDLDRRERLSDAADPAARSRIVRELTDQLTHEFATVIGTLRHYAGREVQNYNESETKRELERLDAVLEATRALGDAATPPVWEELDLAQFVKGLVRDEGLVHSYDAVMAAGPDPHIVTASRGLIALFLRNAIANGVEATLDLHGTERPVLVVWGTDDREHWISVLDEGAGPAAALDELSPIGASTKDGHPGMGLAIAAQVATSLNGDLSLKPQDRGGCACRLAWPRPRAET